MPIGLSEYCCFNWLLRPCCRRRQPQDDDGEAFDDDAEHLSHVGEAVYDVLRKKHRWHHHTLWNVTSGNVVALDVTPPPAALFVANAEQQPKNEMPENHSDWFPEKLGEIVCRTEVWCDIMSLGPPDGKFLTVLQAALEELHQKKKKIVVRILFGNIIGMPVNCNKLIKTLTKNIPFDSHLRLWLGAWRKVSVSCVL